MRLGTPKKSGNFRGNYTRGPSRSYESRWKKMIGKPYSGKPNVRFDEGELEIEPSATTPALYSTTRNNRRERGETLFLGRFHYLLWTLRFSSSKKLRFEDQIETFTHFFKGLTFGKICSTFGCPKIGTVDFFLKSLSGHFNKTCLIYIRNPQWSF